MAEVLGRYSNQASVGVGLRDLAEASAANVRKKPWEPPKLVGTTRVRRLLSTEMVAMTADYERGLGCVVLSRKYGVAENTVLAWLKGAGIEMRAKNSVDPEAVREMADLRAQGWTLRAIGERFGVTRQTVAKKLSWASA